MNPMFYGTFAYLAFSSFFVIGGLWLVHGIKKDRRKREARSAARRSSCRRAVGFNPLGAESHSHSPD
jgi:hypothetical protein